MSNPEKYFVGDTVEVTDKSLKSFGQQGIIVSLDYHPYQAYDSKHDTHHGTHIDREKIHIFYF